MKLTTFGKKVMDSNMEAKLKELRKNYLKKLEGVLSDLKELFNDEPISTEVLYSKIHTISGTSGVYGLKELSNNSSNFEIYLKDKNKNISSFDSAELKGKLYDYIQYLEKMLLTGGQ